MPKDWGPSPFPETTRLKPIVPLYISLDGINGFFLAASILEISTINPTRVKIVEVPKRIDPNLIGKEIFPFGTNGPNTFRNCRVIE
jgi:hypothetical protein